MKTILIIDDSVPLLQLMSRLLKNEDLDIMKTTTAEEAEHLLNRLPTNELPDLILLDFVLPGMGGFSFLRLLKAIPRLSHIPVIGMSAFNMPPDLAEFWSGSCIDQISKPNIGGELLQKIRKVIGSTEKKVDKELYQLRHQLV